MKMLSNRNPSILIMSTSEYLFLSKECFFKNVLPQSRTPNTVTGFENEGVKDNTLESV